MERIFLGWNSHLLKLASDYLIAKYQKANVVNLKNVSIVVSGAKTYKRLLEILLITTKEKNLQLIPPRTYTPQKFFDEIIIKYSANNKRILTEFESLLFFIKSIENNKELIDESIFKKNILEDNTTSNMLLAQKIYALYKDISCANLSFNDIPAKAMLLNDIIQDNRWDIFNSIYEEYKDLLDKNEVTDIFIERKNFIFNNNELSLDSDVVILNIPDLNKIFCDIIKKIKSPVYYYVYAPQNNANLFDDFGNVNVDAWLNENLEINDDNVLIANNTKELGELVGETLIKLSSKYSSKDIVIGCTEDNLIPCIIFECNDKNLDVVSVRENSIDHTSVYQMIDLLKSYVLIPTFVNFSNFVRHSDILEYLTFKNPSLTKQNILFALDKYNSDHLPYLFKYVPSEIIANSILESDKIVLEVYNIIVDLIPKYSESKSLYDWSHDILKIFLDLYSNVKISKTNKDDKELLAIYNSYKNALLSLNSSLCDSQLKFAFSDALTLLNTLVKNTTFGIVLNENTVEIQGWLEIQNDDSEIAILTGLKEGSWPESINHDEFLPNSLRKILGLVDNDMRYARDLFMTKSILHSKKHVYFIPLKYDLLSDSTNLLSKLLLATDSETQAKRLLMFYDSEAQENEDLAVNAINESIVFFKDPQLTHYDLNTISVSALKVYKECPYKFYLEYVLKLNTVQVNINELNNIMFGNLIHELLDSFGKSEIKDSKDSVEIYNFLLKRLEIYIDRNFGKNYLPTIDVQIVGIKNLLEFFSKWQADRASSGWSIFATEQKFDDFFLTIDKQVVKIVGRIDRLDYNREENRWMIIDYKTGLIPQDLNKIYKKRQKTWIDYQMPLYLEYFFRKDNSKKVGFSYLNLFHINNKSYFSEIFVEDQELEDAIFEVEELVRNIRAGIFWPPSKNSLKLLNAFDLS